MKLTTSRLVLRPWTQEDAPALYVLASDPEVGPACGWLPHRSVEESRRAIILNFSGENTFAVTLQETEQPIGCISLFSGSVCSGRDLELGYWLGKQFWDQGYATEAARRMVKYAFGQLDCPRVWCCHYADNPRSRRVIEKLRFRREFLREEALPALGLRRLTYYFSRYRDEERRGGE